MNVVGVGKRVRIYVGEGDQWGTGPLYLALLEKLRAEGCAGATAFRGIAGFGANRRIHSASLLDISADLPIVVEWIDAPERVERVLLEIRAMVVEGMITSEDVSIVMYQHRVVADISARRPVRDVMTRDVTSVTPDARLRDAVQLLVNQNYRALPVVDDRQHVIGMVTSGDLVERGGLRLRMEVLSALTAEQLAYELAVIEDEKTIADVMTQPAVTVDPEANLADVAHLMVTRRLKRLPVVDRAGALVGMISRVDLLRTRGDAYPAAPSGEVGHAGKTIGEIMRTDVPVVGRGALLGELLDAVASTRLNRAIVVDDDRRVLGIVTDAALLRRLSPEDHPSVLRVLMSRLPFVHLSPEERANLVHIVGSTAEQLMDSGVPTTTENAPLAEAIKVMLAERRKILPVVDATERLAGAVDRADLLRALGELGR
jgi:CBS-domain-containing membrane protein